MWVAERGSDRFALQRLSGFFLPGVLTVSSLGILVVDNWYHVGLPAVVLAAVTLAVAGVRLAFRPALRLAREQLRSSEDRYQLLFEQNPVPMVTYDRQTLQIVAASNAMVATYGYSLKELQGMTVEDLRPPEEAESAPADPVSDPDGQRSGPAPHARSARRHRRDRAQQDGRRGRDRA
jgi:PAS domain S-box-containing protein